MARETKGAVQLEGKVVESAAPEVYTQSSKTTSWEDDLRTWDERRYFEVCLWKVDHVTLDNYLQKMCYYCARRVYY